MVTKNQARNQDGRLPVLRDAGEGHAGGDGEEVSERLQPGLPTDRSVPPDMAGIA